MQATMQCWEITQCKKKGNCLCAKNSKIFCWELSREYSPDSFHICCDCLVYVAKQNNSTLTDAEFYFIMEKRKEFQYCPAFLPEAAPERRNGSSYREGQR